MKRTPLKRGKPLARTRSKPRRTLKDRCTIRGCSRIARIETWCVPHAESRADRLFSLWVRARDGRCTAEGKFGIECNGPLQAAHIVGRRNKTLRFDPRNVHALCAAHHRHVDQHGSEGAKYQWGSTVLGPAPYEVLMFQATEMTDRVVAIEVALEWLALVAGLGDAS